MIMIANMARHELLLLACNWRVRSALACPRYLLLYSLNRIYLDKARMAHQAQTCNAENRMEDINHVTRSISDPSAISILTSQNERGQLGGIDPMQSP